MTIGTKIIPYDTRVSPVAPKTDGGTKVQQTTGTIGVVRFLKDTFISNSYRLQIDLTALARVEDDKYVVVNYQVDEYGIGNSLEEAQQDLLDSLVDYLESLERRENRLADRELHKLQLLRNMLARR